MGQIDPRADQVVRAAVDAFLEGRFAPQAAGETSFATKNSRYRLVDGQLVEAPHPNLVGAELVGWLVEARGERTVRRDWLPGARAVLVDRRQAQHIIVTSVTRLDTPDAGEGTPLPASSATATPPPAAARPAGAVPPPPRRVAPIHAPPRPMAARPVAMGPLPAPAPPPRRTPIAEVPDEAPVDPATIPPPPTSQAESSMSPFILSRVTRRGGE